MHDLIPSDRLNTIIKIDQLQTFEKVIDHWNWLAQEKKEKQWMCLRY
jgi:hypothetical protein